MKTTPKRSRQIAALAALSIPCAFGHAQASADAGASAEATQPQDQDIVVLTPFEVSASASEGYQAATTLAGNRLKTELRDIGSAVSVVTAQFLKDTGATDNASLLKYTTGTEVGGVQGNFAGTGDGPTLTESTLRPNENTRIRGLAAADNTRDFFRSEIPWDSYNVDRIDLQRGPNSILFGQGSPAGIINAGTKGARFTNAGSVEFRYGSFGSNRASLDVNQVLLADQLAIRLNGLRNDQKFQQDPAFSLDKRLAGAIRFEPAFLKKSGARTVFKANFETGRVDSNNPRELPPADYITPWFASGGAGLNQSTYSGAQVWDHLSGRINHGQAREGDYAAPNVGPIPYFSPWLSGAGFGTSAGPNPVAYYTPNGAQSLWITEVSAPLQGHGRASDGSIDGDIKGYVANPGSLRGINGTSTWAANAKLPYSSAGIFKDNQLSDASVFDFYNNLIDGDTKREWQRFHNVEASLTQTFFDDQVGFSLEATKEHYEAGQTALLGGLVRLYIDPMAVYNDGTPDSGQTGEPFSDGTVNPNVGKPFVSSNNNSNNVFTSDRESQRATGFVTHNFAKDGKSWLHRILGTQTITGLLADDQQKTDFRAWQRYGYLDDSIYNLEQRTRAQDAFNSGSLTPTQIVYLGDSLKGKTASGANISGVQGHPTLTNGSIRYFNDTWNHPLDPAAVGYVNPAAPWTNYFFTGDPTKLAPGQPGNAANMNSTQAENPANYVGWTTTSLNVTDAEASAANRDRLTTLARLVKTATKSKALVWQGKMLDNSIVGTYGWRQDVNKSWAYTDSVKASNPAIDWTRYQLSENYKKVEVQSRAYSVVAHLVDLPGLKNLTKNLPFEVSLSYNISTNFKPDSSRVDIYGEALASPEGKTIDKGIVIATRDGRYSLKVNRFTTSTKNDTDPNSAALGAQVGAWMKGSAAFANVFGYDIGPWDWKATNDNHRLGDGTWMQMRYDFFEANVNSAHAQADEAAAIAGFRTFQNKVDDRFWSTWGMHDKAWVTSGVNEVTSDAPVVPNGFTVPEDTSSSGYEVELNAEPVKNWRLTLNASKITATRTNVGGANLKELMAQITEAVAGPGGNLHWWWGTDDVKRTKDTWYTTIMNGQTGPGALWTSMSLLDGTNVPELSKWHVNLISNYDITTGFLKGVNWGGGARYQSGVIIGFPPMGDPNNPGDYSMDLAHPYKAPSQTSIDLWVGYRRKLTSKIDWHVQLNVQNAFKGDDLIAITAQAPIHVQPSGQGYEQADGTPAGYRIAPAQTWWLTNTFEF